ncbi:MAG: hypothetical protein KJ060_03440, partial [Candidatus Hydrogenedentes bacterium]|nr:hypothetical protein [Candidatus Hydrogenedentota bacterium]
PPGKLQLAVAVYLHGGPRLRRTVHVELLPDQTLVQDIVVTVPLSLVHGRVLGIPADCTATAWLLPGTHRPTGEKFDAQVTDSQEILPDGKIEFTAVEPGHYTILVAGYPKGPESTGKRGRPGMAVATSGGRASKWFDLDFSNDFERMQTWHLDAYPWVATVNVDVQDGQKTEVEISL